ncbi:uncharacterized protein si:dkey-237j10.2 [Gadus macrocephalus]|uniref:uncharacterized protein si:dkey-237j10.2 n=1 Tax=Gadus macrocephalus TaxID=80720 RepID=UPI0028CB3BFE|nr:uncharacterized protein si:dkey-237j10.2 [Gadus macrocephalus]
MLSESFLQTLPYRDEKRYSSATKLQGGEHTYPQTLRGDTQHGGLGLTESGEHSHTPQALRTDLGPNEGLGPRFAFPPEFGLMIPGRACTLNHYPHHSGDFQSECSLIRQYPDLRLRQESDEATSPNSSTSCHCPSTSVSGRPLQSLPCTPSFQGPDRQPGTPVPDTTHPLKPGTSNPDEGYLEMTGNRDLEFSLLGLEPLSNSLLNGLLEKHLDELYREHFTDSLARCNSQLGHSLLRGLVPLPQPSGQAQASDFMGASLQGVVSREGGFRISYLNTTSHFSSPVLRISDAESSPRPPPPTPTHT